MSDLQRLLIASKIEALLGESMVTNTITAVSPSDAIAFGEGSVWLINTSQRTLTRVRPVPSRG
jgi:hypothetical protein